MAESFSRSLAFYCAAVEEAKPWVGHSHIAMDAASPSCPRIEISCEVGFVDPPIGANLVNSFAINSTLSQIKNRMDLYKAADAQAIWREADTDSELAFAIAARALQLKAETDPGCEVIDLRRFTIGPHFRASLGGAQSAHAAPYAMSTLDTCARVTAGLPQPDTNPFFTTAGSGVQRTRATDGAQAWRIHVSKHGVGVRLMYWELPNGYLEFSNVAPKAQAEIFE